MLCITGMHLVCLTLPGKGGMHEIACCIYTLTCLTVYQCRISGWLTTNRGLHDPLSRQILVIAHNDNDQDAVTCFRTYPIFQEWLVEMS